MEIKGKVHCFFEQSGTFKNEFIKLGIPAEDYDIQNNFKETDHISDLFSAIRGGYRGEKSLFDDIDKDDLILAFFPCIYFCCMSQMDMSWTAKNYRKLSDKEKADAILARSANREEFFRLLVQLVAIAKMKGLRLIIENPWSQQTFLKNGNFIMPPTFVDNNRMIRGDYFVKPTAYWFINCDPTYGTSYQKDKKQKSILHSRPGVHAGLCSEERSLISPDYARNFICDFIIGKNQPQLSEQLLFE